MTITTFTNDVIQTWFKEGEFQKQKVSWAHTLCNAFKFSKEDAIDVCEHLVQTAVDYRKTGKTTIAASGQKTVKTRMGTKDMELPLLDGKLTVALTAAANIGKSNIKYAESTLVLSDECQAHVKTILEVRANKRNAKNVPSPA